MVRRESAVNAWVPRQTALQSLAMGLGKWITGRLRKSMGLECRSAQVKGQNLVYLFRAGTGTPILLIHGYSAEKDNWLPFVRYLPKGRPLLILDLPGHGESDFSFATDYTAPAFRDILLDWLEVIECPCCEIVGNSLGGWIALLIAHAQPQRVNTLGLIDAAGVYPPHPSELQRRLDRGENPMLVSSSEEYEAFMNFVFYRRPYLPWPIRIYMKVSYLTRSKQNNKIWHDMYDKLESIEQLLPDIQHPVLLIWGDQDRVLDPSSVEVFEAGLPHVATVVLKNCGHSPMLEQTKKTAAHYNAHLITHEA